MRCWSRQPPSLNTASRRVPSVLPHRGRLRQDPPHQLSTEVLLPPLNLSGRGRGEVFLPRGNLSGQGRGEVLLPRGNRRVWLALLLLRRHPRRTAIGRRVHGGPAIAAYSPRSGADRGV